METRQTIDRPGSLKPLPQLYELKPAETEQVAGGSPTLPLPPPHTPDPVPW
jgi:hypothetical protein